MTKRPLGHGSIRNMGDFKAVAMDYEYYLTLEDVGRLYCLTDRQVYVLMVQLTYVGWLTRWYNTDDITQTTVGYIQSELMEKLMSCVDISILIDQANLNLVDSVTHNQVESQALRDLLESEYIPDDPTSINPSAPTTDFGSAGDRYDALCSGLTAFVYQFARAQADSARAAQVGGLAAVALVALLLIPGLNFFFVVGASIAVAAGLGTIGVSLEVAIAALTDRTALDAVICYMRDTLSDQDVNETNWGACLDSYPFGVGTHEAIVADFIKSCLDKNYLTILNILGQAYDGTINGDDMPACPCIEPPETCTDFTAGEGLWHVFDTVGDYHTGEGYQGEYFGAYDESVLFVERDATTGLGDATGYSFTLDASVDVHTAFLYVNDVSVGGLFGLTGVSTFTFDEATVGGSWPKDANYKIRLQLTTGGGNTWRLIESCVLE